MNIWPELFMVKGKYLNIMAEIADYEKDLDKF